MSTLDFDELKPTTMTVIVKLKGNVYIDSAFPMFQITRLDLKPRTRSRKKFKIPYCGIPGAILSVIHRGHIRGIVKSDKVKAFKNSITIDLCTTRKNINAKLSSMTIHMCGADSLELAIEAAQHIIDHLENIQKMLDYIVENREAAERVVKWVIENSKDKKYIVDSRTDEILHLNPGDKISDKGFLLDKRGERYVVEEKSFETKAQQKKRESFGCGAPVNRYYIKPVEVYSIKIPKGYPDKYPGGIDNKIANFIIKYATGYRYHEQYSNFIRDILKLNKIIERPLEIKKTQTAMVNYSYTLGMNINRARLAKNINGLEGMIPNYNNTSDHSVKIELPYVPTKEMEKIRKKNKMPKHTFMVYRSGVVTQSAPSVEMAKDAYYKFNKVINSIKHLIAQKPN